MFLNKEQIWMLQFPIGINYAISPNIFYILLFCQKKTFKKSMLI
jgi:hypothetical protein